MQAPTTSIDVGWYKFGSYPGAEGTAVIDGHFGPWLRGGGSVFDNLGSLQKGDLIYVDDERGKTVTFVVTGSQVYDPNANDALVFTSHDDKSHLNLVTCGGDWNDTTQSFAKRLVVFADKQESSS